MGRLTDKFGRKPILASSLLAYALACFFFVLPVHAPWFVIARLVQGAAAGAIEVTALSAVAVLVPEAERGRAVSRVFAAQLLGCALGPLAGVAVSASHLGWAFACAGVASVLAGVVAMRSTLEGGREIDRSEPLPPLQLDRRIIGALVGTATTGLCIGVYESCWSLLMHAHHASELQIRMSWTIFCVPWVVLSPLGGWLADHGNRKVVATVGACSTAFFLGFYPHIHQPGLMMSFGSLEAVITSLSMPSLNSLLTQGGQEREFGRRQGLSATANTGSLALTSATSGALFTLAPSLPFTIVAVTAFTLSLTLPWWWRGSNGRVRMAS